MLINEAVYIFLDKNSGTYSYHRPHCNWAIHFSLNTLRNSWIKSKGDPHIGQLASSEPLLGIRQTKGFPS